MNRSSLNYLNSNVLHARRDTKPLSKRSVTITRREHDEIVHHYVFTVYALDIEHLPLTGKFGAYRTLNLGASWAVTPALQVDVQLLNAADGHREYVWWDGSQTLHSAGEPRSLNVALRASF